MIELNGRIKTDSVFPIISPVNEMETNSEFTTEIKKQLSKGKPMYCQMQQ